MKIELLYRFLFSPFKTIRSSFESEMVRVPIVEGLIGLGFASMTWLTLLSTSYNSNPIFGALFFSVIGLVTVGTQCMFIQFFAQFLGHRYCAKTIFFWFLLCWLPFSINLPLYILSSRFPALDSVFGLLSVVVFFFIMALHIQVLKSAYRVSWGRAFLVYIFPALVLTTLWIAFFVAFILWII